MGMVTTKVAIDTRGAINGPRGALVKRHLAVE
jgi:hypothetical protein